MPGALLCISGPGGAYVARLAGPSDRERLISFYRGLDREALAYRFMGGVSEFEPVVERMLGPGALAVLLEAGDGAVVGVGEAYGVEARVAEVAVTLSGRARGRGLGYALFYALARASLEKGFERLLAYVLPYNVPALRIARRAGGRFQYEPDTVIVLFDTRVVVERLEAVLAEKGYRVAGCGGRG